MVLDFYQHKIIICGGDMNSRIGTPAGNIDISYNIVNPHNYVKDVFFWLSHSPGLEILKKYTFEYILVKNSSLGLKICEYVPFEYIKNRNNREFFIQLIQLLLYA